MATQAGYSAGRVYLQVVPSYRNFLATLRRDAAGPLGKAIADTFEKDLEKRGVGVGEKFGDRVSKNIEKSIDSDRLAAKLKGKIGKALDELGSGNEGYARSLRSLQNDIERTGKVEDRHVDTMRKLSSEMARASSASVDRADGMRLASAATSLDSKAVSSHTSELRRASNEARKTAGAEKGRSNAHRDAASAANRAESAGRGLRGMLAGLRGDSQDGANAFRFFNLAVLALAGAGAGLIPVLAAVVGGLVAFGPILAGLGVGAGVAIFGLSGIGAAVKALGAQQDATSTSSIAFQRNLVNAARAVADARRGLADAYRNSAEGITNALDRQRGAERNLTEAQHDAAQAQRDLTDARKEAKQDQEDLSNRIAQNALDERQGVIDLFNAYNQFGSVMADGGSTNLEREQADIQLKQAQLNLKMIREEQKRLRAEKKKSDREGINGADKVRAAEERLRNALERVRDANDAVTKATRGVTKARRDGARGIADAQRTLTRAQEDYNYALQGGAEAADKTQLAMSKLGPAGKKFALFIFGLKDGLKGLRDEVQSGFLPGLQEGMQAVIDTYGPGFKGFLKDIGVILGNLSVLIGDTFTNDVWKNFFSDFADASKIFLSNGAKTMLNFFTALATVFDLALPTSVKLSDAMLNLSKRFLAWTESKKGQDAIRSFFGYIERVGPMVVDFIGSVAHAFFRIGQALAPIGESILSYLTDMFDYIGRLDDSTLRQLGVAFLAITFALQASAGITAMVSLVGALASAPLLVVVAAVAGLAAGFFLLSRSGKDNKKTFDDFMKTMKPFIKFFKDLYRELKDRIVKVFNEDVKPAIDSIVEAVKRDLLPALERFLPVLKPILFFLADVVFARIGAFIQLIGGVISGVIKILSGLLDFITGVFTGDWGLAWNGIKKIFSGVFKVIGSIIKFFWRIVKDSFSEGWRAAKGIVKRGAHSVKELFVSLQTQTLKVLNKLKDGVVDIFKKIGRLLAKPIVGFLDLVINDGLIDGVRTIQGWVGVKEKNKLKHVGGFGGKYAEGGVLPGFTPGRDVHHFVSPTGGNLHLSGGEAVMRPEFTRAVGGEKGVARINSLARRGMAFAKGGVVWPTKSKHWTTYAGHDGIDLNGPGNGLGDPYYATAPGRVAYTGTGRGYGLKLELDTNKGPTVIYGHSSKILAHAGSIVRAGQMIGRIGYSGHVRPAGPAGSHLHFGLKGEGPDRGALAAAYLGGAKISGHRGASKGLLDSLPTGALKALRNPVGWLKRRAEGGLDKVQGMGGGLLSTFKKLPGKIISSLIGKLKSVIKDGLGVGASFFKGASRSGVLGLLGINPFGGKGSGSPKLYDNGGMLPPGMSTVFNATGKPEPVFSPDQWQKIQRGGLGGGDTYNLKATGADPRKVVDEFLQDIRFEQKRARRSGTLSSKVGAK